MELNGVRDDIVQEYWLEFLAYCKKVESKSRTDIEKSRKKDVKGYIKTGVMKPTIGIGVYSVTAYTMDQQGRTVVNTQPANNQKQPIIMGLSRNNFWTWYKDIKMEEGK